VRLVLGAALGGAMTFQRGDRVRVREGKWPYPTWKGTVESTRDGFVAVNLGGRIALYRADELERVEEKP
jgi:hypothetical protein